MGRFNLSGRRLRLKMNEELKRQTYQKKYMQKKKMLCVCLDKKNDEDIIDWMNQQVSITDSVKRALRAYFNGF